MSERPGPGPRGERFGSRDRLLKRRQFQSCYREGRRIRRRFVTAHVLANDVERPRLGITSSRKVGKAVQRHKVRRRLREIYRRWPGRERLPAVDIVLHVKPDAARAEFASLRRDVLSALGHVADRRRSGSRS